MAPATASFPALGTTAVVAVTSSSRLELAHALLVAELDQIDRACSRFRDDSELAHVNACAGEWVELGPTLLAAVRVAVDAAHATDGLVDPTLGADMRAAGYDRTFALVQAREGWRVELRHRPRASWRHIELDDENAVLRVPAGVELDLGATAKAFAADRAARAIAKATSCGALVSLGGDIGVAGEPPNGGWCVRLADDHAAPLEGAGPRVVLNAGGLATSGTSVRRWRTDRGEAHHVLDPQTGRPARTPWRTVSVAAHTCLDANVAATAAIVLGGEAPEWLEQRGLPSRLVATDGAIVMVAGWPADEEAA
jgi:thiamine biosynthesis lipoprotein